MPEGAPFRIRQQISSRWTALIVAPVIVLSGWPLIVEPSLGTLLGPAIAAPSTWLFLGAFTSFEVVVDSEEVVVRFRYVWPRRRLRIDRVTSCSLERTSWMRGWGIKRVRGGWMWGAYGTTVRLEVGEGSDLVIGCDDSVALFDAVNALLAERSDEGR